MDTQIQIGIDPIITDQYRKAFFCGFKSCLESINVLAEIATTDEDAGENAWQLLQAEYEKFATECDLGEESINH